MMMIMQMALLLSLRLTLMRLICVFVKPINQHFRDMSTFRYFARECDNYKGIGHGH